MPSEERPSRRPVPKAIPGKMIPDNHPGPLGEDAVTTGLRRLDMPVTRSNWIALEYGVLEEDLTPEQRDSIPKHLTD